MRQSGQQQQTNVRRQTATNAVSAKADRELPVPIKTDQKDVLSRSAFPDPGGVLAWAYLIDIVCPPIA